MASDQSGGTPSASEPGDPSTAEELLPLVYDELRELAAHRLAHEAPGQTLQATALVHEAYVHLVAGEVDRSWQNRGHFFAAADEVMRRILIDQARRKRRQKRGGGWRRIDLDAALAAEATPPRPDEALALKEALAQLAEHEPIKAKLVELRYFGGMTVAEAAGTLGISTATAERYWASARAWLARSLHDPDPPAEPRIGDPPKNPEGA